MMRGEGERLWRQGNCPESRQRDLLLLSWGMRATIKGSLRKATGTSGPRTVLFRVSGTIELKAPLEIYKPFLTLAGQSAQAS